MSEGKKKVIDARQVFFQKQKNAAYALYIQSYAQAIQNQKDLPMLKKKIWAALHSIWETHDHSMAKIRDFRTGQVEFVNEDAAFSKSRRDVPYRGRTPAEFLDGLIDRFRARFPRLPDQ
jgi:hypothetical protein